MISPTNNGPLPGFAGELNKFMTSHHDFNYYFNDRITCDSCNCVIQKQFVSKIGDNIWCINCKIYPKMYPKYTCKICSNVISRDVIVELNNEMYCSQCYVDAHVNICHICKKNVTNGIIIDGVKYCDVCNMHK